MRATAPNGLDIVGTLETCPGIAQILYNSFTRNGTSLNFDYAGGTDYYYDDQKTIVRKGQRIFLDDDGNEWSEDQLTLHDD